MNLRETISSNQMVYFQASVAEDIVLLQLLMESTTSIPQALESLQFLVSS